VRQEGWSKRQPEEAVMWTTWNDLPPWWHRVMRVVLVSVALFVSGCTTPGRTSSNPSDLFLEGGYMGLGVQGIKDRS
jgi:hypothetical protein